MTKWKTVVVCLFACALRMVSSQIYGPGNCRLSRLEVVPCLKVFQTTPDPGVNEYSIYQTAFVRGPAGLPVCIVNQPMEGHVPIRPVESIGNDGQVKFLVSPGVELTEPKLYGNQQLVNYSVTCPDGHIAYFNVTFADLEEPNCPAASCEMMQACPLRCVDYLEVNRGEYGVSESCGNDTSSNTDQLELGSFRAIFRTSPTMQRRGFKATITCFRNQDQQPANCTMPSETGEAMMTSPDEGRRRRKRDLEEFHNQWHWHLTYLKRLRRQTQKYYNIRFREINIGHQVVVTFTDKVLTLTDVKTNTIIDSIDNILFLHTFNAQGIVDEFRDSALDKDRLIPFPGPGPMYIVGRHAYFQLFVIDPRGLIPNENETVVLNILTDGQFDALVLEDTPLSEEFLLPATPNPEDIGLPRRRRRQTEERAANYSDSVLLIAIQNENACNPVLRANSAATIQSANSTDVTRLRNQLRDSGSGMPTPLTP